METNENRQDNFDRICKGLNVFFMAAIFCVLAVWFGVSLTRRPAGPTGPSPLAAVNSVPSSPSECATVPKPPSPAGPVPVVVRTPSSASAPAKATSAMTHPAGRPLTAVRPSGRVLARFPRMVLLPPQPGWPFDGDEDPFTRIAQMRERMADWMGDDDWDLTPSSPAVDMREGKDGFDIRFELPAWADPSTLKVEAQGDVLSLSVRSADKHSSMKQSFRVPGSGISTNVADAAVSNGVLCVHVHPVAAPAGR